MTAGTTAQPAPLHGLTVLVTRPGHQNAGLCHALAAAGARALPLPLLAIDGPADAQTAARRLARACQDDLWIFTSVNAVAWAARLYPPADTPWPSHLAAAGRATAAALAALGRNDVWVPETGDGAAAILAMPRIQAHAGGCAGIVCGERSLPTLGTGLRSRGWRVHRLVVYRRRPLTPSVTELATALGHARAAIVTSGDSLRQLHAVTPATMRPGLKNLQLVLPSTRVVEQARRLGFRRSPLLPERVGDDAFVEALVRWHRFENKSKP